MFLRFGFWYFKTKKSILLRKNVKFFRGSAPRPRAYAVGVGASPQTPRLQRAAAPRGPPPLRGRGSVNAGTGFLGTFIWFQVAKGRRLWEFWRGLVVRWTLGHMIMQCKSDIFTVRIRKVTDKIWKVSPAAGCVRTAVRLSGVCAQPARTLTSPKCAWKNTVVDWISVEMHGWKRMGRPFHWKIDLRKVPRKVD